MKLSDIRIIKSHLFALACLFVSGLAASQGLAPQVSNDSAVVTLGSEVVVDILANDTGDINPSTVATYVPQQPSFGYLGINSQTGSITYTPYIGLTNATSDSFGYTVRSNSGIQSTVGTVEISFASNVNSADEQPATGPQTPTLPASPSSNEQFLADDDSAVVVLGSEVLVNVLSNDTGNIDPTTVATHQPQQPGFGYLGINSQTGAITYTPYIGLTGATSDSFGYTVRDNNGTLSNVATVNITIASDDVIVEEPAPEAQDTPAANPPVTTPSNQPFQAGNDSAVVMLGSEVLINILSNDTGAVDPTTVATHQPQQPSFGYLGINSQTGAITYTPYIGLTGSATDTFGYTVRNSNGVLSNVATVSVTINSDGDQVQNPVVINPITPASPAPTPTPTDPVDAVVIAGDLTALRRSGQTFLTWQEIGSSNGYHVYRSNSPINSNNLSNATRITDRWGPLDNNTSRNRFGGPRVPANFVISDLASPLSDNTGLFVYTTQPGDSSVAYYAVTSINSTGNESTLITLDSPLNESVANPTDVLTASVNQGRGRIYTQFMDYSNWNPTLNGYTYNYAVALPANYNPSVSYPLMLELHAYFETFKAPPASEFNTPVITLLPHDPGPNVGTRHSWWYGYARDHDYSNGGLPTSGQIENFTEQRVMRAIDSVIANPGFNVDANRVHAFGHSMGGSGALSFGMRYGSIISGVYASEPMTNYAESDVFIGELLDLWGTQSSDLRITNSGPHSNDIQAYQGVRVWDWMNHQKQLLDRRADDMAFLMTFHGKQDRVIDWQTQGRPIANALNNGSRGFAARNLGAISHTWVGFVSVNTSLFGFGFDDDFAWKYPLDLSFPSIQNASGSSPLAPANSGDDAYNTSIEWATPQTPFAASIIDTSSQYVISLRSTAGTQTANVTPRRTQAFDPSPGQQCSWSAVNNNNAATIGSGSATADSDSLITISGVSIVTGSGTRLSVSCP